MVVSDVERSPEFAGHDAVAEIAQFVACALVRLRTAPTTPRPASAIEERPDLGHDAREQGGTLLRSATERSSSRPLP
jgi:hypothetical protein